ncbi:hypothetical protein [Sphingobacterium sp. T2]|uniref:hypothetical protein n=1 Tax=Sphingobacterium sp. T2 TaxID=1590596 RepID=UPI000B058B1E|nr:hypothetical protein [Sphingobacterium sp. T2]
MELIRQNKNLLLPQRKMNWQGRPEWFFNREYTDTYEQWYEGPISGLRYGRRKSSLSLSRQMGVLEIC